MIVIRYICWCAYIWSYIYICVGKFAPFCSFSAFFLYKYISFAIYAIYTYTWCCYHFFFSFKNKFFFVFCYRCFFVVVAFAMIFISRGSALKSLLNSGSRPRVIGFRGNGKLLSTRACINIWLFQAAAHRESINWIRPQRILNAEYRYFSRYTGKKSASLI